MTYTPFNSINNTYSYHMTYSFNSSHSRNSNTKRVLLLAVSCKNGGLCPGGLDLDDPRKWIRIVKDDGQGGSVQGEEIDFADKLDVITFSGRPVPMGKQRENWVIDDDSCENIGKFKVNGNSSDNEILKWAYENYSYHGFWGNCAPFLEAGEFEAENNPSETILLVSNVRAYKNNYGKTKIDFDWNHSPYRICNISLTDQNFYTLCEGQEVNYKKAYLVISIPKELWEPENHNQPPRAYKYVSAVYEI